MIDTLEAQRARAASLRIDDILASCRLDPDRDIPSAMGRFALLTLHRPSNVDDPGILSDIVAFLTGELARELMLLWTIHPRTEKRLKSFGLWDQVLSAQNLLLLKPMGYHELLRLNMAAAIVLTDSGGLQEECCVLGTPCLTLRWNTERPITLRSNGGASELVGNDVGRIRDSFCHMLRQDRVPARPERWDGHTAPRIVAALVAAGKGG
jgi:UDP-N-acetylglucosamine 2-epimerase (non-hydrolysing)